eukprot:TRINITY_DN277_c0_g2_i3.p2 TRINITY_DN277_c0_g2~~TRINITY_DN277_c0_g2_i3.p2  ORF type:complete len:812 (+),score=225.35 TRINITY_DN277_c0_g2_i3:5780-8215(+)
MIKQNLELAKVTEEQKENETALAQLTENIEKQQKEMEELKGKKSYSDYELQDLTNKKALLQADLEKRQKEEWDRIKPELDRLEEGVKYLNSEIEWMDKEAEKKNKQIETLEQAKIELEAKYEEAKEEHEKLQEEYISAKQKPLNVKKMLQGDENGMEIVDSELEKLRARNEKIKQSITSSSKEYAVFFLFQWFVQELQTLRDTKESQKRESAAKISKLTREFDEETKVLNELKAEELQDLQEKKEIDKLKDTEITAKKSMLENNNKKRKQKDGLKKEINKLDKDIAEIEDQIKQRQTEISSTAKTLEERKAELARQKEIGVELQDEIKLFTAKTANKDIGILKIKEQVESHKNALAAYEADLVKHKKEEAINHKNIKSLTIMKEKMARTASQATQQARERKEELKILWLAIVDLSKKHQETKFRLDSFVAMYENVKNERNKYVTMIQNCSQALAENKEKIKILQNEVEILRNELLEKEQNLRDKQHKLKREIFEHERQAKEISQLRDVFGEKQAQTIQQSKEISNFDLILQGINRDIKQFTRKYEEACENRNYMGIQLIDRNDELCILYEKANIQENILKRGEAEIKAKEEDIRMFTIELSEKQRELELVQKKAPEVPELAKKVVDLKTELEHEKVKVKELSEKVEDPESNPGRIREIETYIPDQEFLEAKIHVLEERLNSKKEGLLEKELVLEEISNLSEKLRKQALEGRKGTLELAEKINEFRAKTTELSRKMLATVAEVSMYQATAMKLEQEKQAKEKVMEEAKERIVKGLPPTPESEEEWERIERRTAISQELKVRFVHSFSKNRKQ